jgi:hypothetical protein
MKRFPKILIATCATIALSASLALAAEAVTPKTTAATQQVSCPGAAAAGYTGQMGPGMMNGNAMMGSGMMRQGMMNQGMMNGSGQTQMRGTGATAMMGRTL